MKKQEKDLLLKTFKDKLSELKQKTEALTEAFKSLKQTGINEDVLYFALQKCAQKYNTSYQPISIKDVRAICKGIEDIAEYLFPEEKK